MGRKNPYNLKPILFLWAVLCCPSGYSQEAIRIHGHVTHLSKPVSHANVTVKGTSKGTKTNKKGRYSIVVQTTDVLMFSYVGMKTVEVTVDEILDNPNVRLDTKTEKLDEVVIKRGLRRSQKELMADYPYDKNLIKTSRGILDKDKSSSSMRIIDKEDLRAIGIDFLEALRVYYPTMRISETRDSVFLRDFSIWGETPAIYEVDGIYYERPPTYLSVDEIDRIAVMIGNGAIGRYGPKGVGGVIIINTKQANRIDELGVTRVYDNGALMDSLSHKALAPAPYVPNIASHLKAFEKAATEKEVFRLLKKQVESNNEPSPSDFLEIANFVKDRFKNTKTSKEILDLANSELSDNAEFLKALAFHYEELGQWDIALELYLKALKLKTRDAQSHRNLANAYAQTGNYNKALLVYTQYERAVSILDTIPYDKYGSDLLMATESDNLIRLVGKDASLDNNGILKKLDNHDTRLVLEWNRSDADFELQVVDPLSYFDSWSNHASHEETGQNTAKIKGYSSKQFFLDDNTKGDWKININYLGDLDVTPTYLKATVYFDYGKPSEKKEIRVFKLSQPNLKFQLFAINNQKETLVP
ncbi:carboxypeptidase-like regulatory domain-containing protein [Flagellimonas myxillae]|uniref:carboxypeptidase-like regulatory domain-containing protein n=1 Tax=Flagellimonas myxillae TaxID=2942214 RepID=UPI00201EFCBF|nr:tetratricopeptide repeat protein [Muricauda myxillae]MCL6265430.1 carboxypeptidase-like regulatory domain-containing protein [Muricauda myxillae]